MGHYVNLTLKEASAILSQYRFSPVLEIHPLSLGISNSNYKIVTREKTLLLKVSNDKDMDQLEREMQILLYLQKQGFPLALSPFPLKRGGAVYHEPPYFGVVFPFLSGQAPVISSSSCHEIGKALASLHRVTQGKQSSLEKIRPSTDVGFEQAQIEEYVAHNPTCPLDYRDIFHRVFPQGLARFGQQNFEQGLIHGDLYYDNTLFQGDKLMALLDFEQAGVGTYLFDLGVSISGTCLMGGKIHPPLVTSFLKGYESIRVLPVQERKFLQEAILLGLFSISLWRIKRFTEGNLDPLKATSYRELLERALDYQNALGDRDEEEFL